MIYIIHQYDEQRGWNLSKFSQSLADFDSMNDQWAFNHLLKNDKEYVEWDNTMWTIEWNSNNTEKN